MLHLQCSHVQSYATCASMHLFTLASGSRSTNLQKRMCRCVPFLPRLWSLIQMQAQQWCIDVHVADRHICKHSKCSMSNSVRDEQHTGQFEHLGFLIVCKAFRQVQVSIPSVLHHISTIEVTVCEPNFVPGFMQVAKHLHKRNPNLSGSSSVSTHKGSMGCSCNAAWCRTWILSESMLLVKDIESTFSAFVAMALCFQLWDLQMQLELR